MKLLNLLDFLKVSLKKDAYSWNIFLNRVNHTKNRHFLGKIYLKRKEEIN